MKWRLREEWIRLWIEGGQALRGRKWFDERTRWGWWSEPVASVPTGTDPSADNTILLLLCPHPSSLSTLFNRSDLMTLTSISSLNPINPVISSFFPEPSLKFQRDYYIYIYPWPHPVYVVCTLLRGPKTTCVDIWKPNIYILKKNCTISHFADFAGWGWGQIQIGFGGFGFPLKLFGFNTWLNYIWIELN